MQNSSGETSAEVAGLSDLKAIVITSERMHTLGSSLHSATLLNNTKVLKKKHGHRKYRKF